MFVSCQSTMTMPSIDDVMDVCEQLTRLMCSAYERTEHTLFYHLASLHKSLPSSAPQSHMLHSTIMQIIIRYYFTFGSTYYLKSLRKQIKLFV